MSEKKVILKASDLSKTFSNDTVQQHVLKNLNLSVYKGDFTVIMGNSGSGKSTLLYSLSGMNRTRKLPKYRSSATTSSQCSDAIM